MKVHSPQTQDQNLLSIFPEHSSISPDGELAIGGVAVTELADRLGTPAYIVDEAGLRSQGRRMREGLAALRRTSCSPPKGCPSTSPEPASS